MGKVRKSRKVGTGGGGSAWSSPSSRIPVWPPPEGASVQGLGPFFIVTQWQQHLDMLLEGSRQRSCGREQVNVRAQIQPANPIASQAEKAPRPQLCCAWKTHLKMT